MAEDGIRLALEGLARAVDRRSFLKRTFQLGLAGSVGATLGSLGAAREVFANNQNCKACDFPPVGSGGVTCTSKGYQCPAAGGCPTGCKVCKLDGTCPSHCGYQSGWWYVCGCGGSGVGCVKCYDCQCPSSSTNCNNLCGCRSTYCWCCSCRTPQDVAHEIERAAAGALLA